MTTHSLEHLQAKILQRLHQFHSDPASADICVPGAQSPADELRKAIVEFAQQTSIPEARALVRKGKGWPAALGDIPSDLDLKSKARTPRSLGGESEGGGT